ncbi:MAG TPA: SDR family oxidoreductase [Gammaproteobacteria bacterium]|jgi:NAD(P)-dependent dehydrogenase (short-subunit alcohol dehydrogenase family)|nr:SDR family oxidoreductase [Gammaproteobacteria bacterium]
MRNSNYLIITGGSRGIGEKTIALFLQQAWQAINIARSACTLPQVSNFNIDLSDPQALKPQREALIAKLQQANKICVVHNASAYQKDDILSLTEENLRSVLEIGLVAPVVLNQLIIPYMQAGSSIIYIGSTLSEQAVAHRASYVIAKHGLIGLMRATCQDLAGKSISTCCICPGFVNTKMLTDTVPHAVLDEVVQQKVTAQRLIEPEEIAELIYFSAMHPVVNGAVLHANLGQVMS